MRSCWVNFEKSEIFKFLRGQKGWSPLKNVQSICRQNYIKSQIKYLCEGWKIFWQYSSSICTVHYMDHIWAINHIVQYIGSKQQIFVHYMFN